MKIKMYSRNINTNFNDPIVEETKDGIKLLHNGSKKWNDRIMKKYKKILNGSFDEKVKELENNDNGKTYINYKTPHFMVILS